ncbi:hypothetical protein P3S68_033985 [Capsicum galapagoense]
MKVEIVSTKFIKPSLPTPNHLQNYKLSFFDQIAAEDDDSISCKDQGVKFVKAKVNSKLNEFLEKAHKDVNLALLCWPQDTWDVDDTNLFIMPIVIVQITEFECGIPEDKIDFLSINLADVFPSRDLSKLLLPRLPQEDREEAKLVAKRLYINESAISRLREEVGDLCFKPSRVEMIVALLWRALIRATEKKHGHLRRSLMGVPINMRPKLKSLPQIEKSFGNLVIEAPVKFIPGEINSMELHNFVRLIRDTVKETIVACDKTSPDDVVAAVANIYNEGFQAQEWGASDEVDMYTSSSLCRFPIQEADFGWGQPCLMHFGSRHNQVCWLYDAECGNGICVQMDLKETNAKLFECEDDIKAFFEF